jgi:hypothetical protein
MNRQESELFTHLILAWHRHFGVKGRPDPAYRISVHSMAEKDLSSRETQISIANLQISGIWEWAYSQVISDELWMKECKHYEIMQLAPKNLGEAARKVITLLTGDGEKRLVVRFLDREDLLARARIFYEEFAGEETLGLGAVSFLLSCSIERDAGFRESGQITLLSGTSLGVGKAPQGRPLDLLELVRSRKLTVGEVIGTTGDAESVGDRDGESKEES